MDESGNRSILDMEGFNLIDFSTEDDSLIDSLLLEPGTRQSSGVLNPDELSNMIGNEEKLFPGIQEDGNRSCDSSRVAQKETSTSGTLQGDELFEDVRASTRRSGQASNVEGSSTEKKLRTKTLSKGSLSLVHKPSNGLKSRTSVSETSAKRASLGSKNVKMKQSVKSTGGTGAPVLKARSSSSSKNMVSKSPPSTKKELKTASSSLESGSTTSETPKFPLDSSKGKEYLNRSKTVKIPSTVASRTRNPIGSSHLSADEKQARSSLIARKSLPSRSVGGMSNTASGSIGLDQGKLNRLKGVAPSTLINSNKAVKPTPAITKSGTFAIPGAQKEVSLAPGVGKSLLRSKSNQTIGQGLSDSSSSSLVKEKNGSMSFPNKQVRTKHPGTPPFKVSKITPIDVGSETEDMFLVTAEEDDLPHFSYGKETLNSIPKRKSVSHACSKAVLTARVPLASRDSLCNSGGSLHASKVPETSVVQKQVIMPSMVQKNHVKICSYS